MSLPPGFLNTFQREDPMIRRVEGRVHRVLSNIAYETGQRPDKEGWLISVSHQMHQYLLSIYQTAPQFLSYQALSLNPKAANFGKSVMHISGVPVFPSSDLQSDEIRIRQEFIA